jgi:hypothetical protein
LCISWKLKENSFIQIIIFRFPTPLQDERNFINVEKRARFGKARNKRGWKDEESISVKLNRPTGPRRGICKAGKRNKSPEREIRKPAKKINSSNDDFLGRHPTCQRRRRRIACDGNCIRRRMPAIKKCHKKEIFKFLFLTSNVNV